eukprot:TRINITY_DN23544_c0_g5_i1.p1 TRINITY_DN23544_c0_g5~~TRINITY_DN23544_c0_g5_i1.p1  ORF type:complete len:1129 (+),score=278.28 TRINITY_DN23544_c0_g5_i1:144-3530(+)
MVILGVCAMEKKASSKAMRAILDHLLAYGDVEVVQFPEEVILHSPVEDWPHPVDVLASFFSEGFPLDKAEAYVALRRPYCINDLTAQRILLDRRRVYALLEENKIPHPQAVVVDHTSSDEPASPTRLSGTSKASDFTEAEDFIKVAGVKISKPFVEKPIDAEDHNIMIYYPSAAGGGAKRLFRKVGDRSSDFDPHVQSVRRDGTYLYEPFMKTAGTDIKVYTVGPEYAHAEARKSPVLDGKVNRGEDGKEVRVPVVLTPKEKEMARRVCLAFGQTVCGFDLLRTKEGSFVIDVNGWSFVKGVPKYYEDCAAVLHSLMLENLGMAPRRSLHTVLHGPLTTQTSKFDENTAEHSGERETSRNDDRWQHEELLAVLAVMRHGDRTPKNKMKLSTRRREFVALHKRWAAGPRKEAKLKSPKQLQEVLDLTFAMLGDAPKKPTINTEKASRDDGPSEGNSSNSEPDDQPQMQRALSIDEHTVEALQLIRAVLEEGGHFDGIYRKVQLKPTAWTEQEEVTELLVVLKYGGILTPAGEAQAERLGHKFRLAMYPGELETAEETPSSNQKSSNGLLRLHATQRHDFKVYSSDEGRVQMSAAAFTRGLLDLEAGSLTPICVALVETDPVMLDDLPWEAQGLLDEAKSKLLASITGSGSEGGSETSEREGERVPQKLAEIAELRACVARVCEELRTNCGGSQPVGSSACGPKKKEKKDEKQKTASKQLSGAANEEAGGAASSSLSFQPPPREQAQSPPEGAEQGPPLVCSTTKPVLVMKRWQKLYEDMWEEKKGTWNISKVPEIYDAVKYDLIHHPRLARSFVAVYQVARELNNILVPNEYGFDERSRARIGATVSGGLLRKLLIDMRNSAGTGTPAESLPETKLVTAVQYLRRIFAGRSKWLRQSVADAADEKSPPKAATQEEDDQEDDEHKEAEFIGADACHAAYMRIRTPNRKVRTRLYFTSESHIQALMNVLRYCQNGVSWPMPGSQKSADEVSSSTCPSIAEETSGSLAQSATDPGIVCSEAHDVLRAEPVFDYLTQIVFRLYEDKRAPPGSPERHRVEVLFSPGAAANPTTLRSNDHTMPIEEMRPLHVPGKPLTLTRLQQLLGPYAKAKESSGLQKNLSTAFTTEFKRTES